MDEKNESKALLVEKLTRKLSARLQFIQLSEKLSAAIFFVDGKPNVILQLNGHGVVFIEGPIGEA